MARIKQLYRVTTNFFVRWSFYLLLLKRGLCFYFWIHLISYQTIIVRLMVRFFSRCAFDISLCSLLTCLKTSDGFQTTFHHLFILLFQFCLLAAFSIIYELSTKRSKCLCKLMLLIRMYDYLFLNYTVLT